MPKRSKREDANQTAHRTLLEAIGERPKTPRVPKPNPAKDPVELGRLGGLKGGQARAKKLSAKRRVEIAKDAARKRWRQDGSSPSS